MKRIDTSGHVGNRFSDGDPQQGVRASVVNAEWLNHVQEELAQTIEGAGIELNTAQENQLLQAIPLLGRFVAPERFGAKGDGLTDSALAFAAALALGTSMVVPATAAYQIGDGVTNGSALVLGNGAQLEGNGCIFLHDALTPEGFARLFELRGSNIRLRNFVVDGKGLVRQAMNFEGEIRDCVIEDVHFKDLVNFGLAISPGSVTGLGTEHFDELHFRRVRIDGATGDDPGDGGGANWFPRNMDANNRPLSGPIYWDDCYIDVTNGSANMDEGGPQALKGNNSRGGRARGSTFIGGDIGGIVISNGIQDYDIDRCTFLKGQGINISCGMSLPLSRATSRIRVRNNYIDPQTALGYRNEAISIDSGARNSEVVGNRGEGDCVIAASNNCFVDVIGVAGAWPENGAIITWPGGQGTLRITGGAQPLTSRAVLASLTAYPSVGDALTSGAWSATVAAVDKIDENRQQFIFHDNTFENGDFRVDDANIIGSEITNLDVDRMILTGGPRGVGRYRFNSINRPVVNGRLGRIKSHQAGGTALIVTPDAAPGLQVERLSITDQKSGDAASVSLCDGVGIDVIDIAGSPNTQHLLAADGADRLRIGRAIGIPAQNKGVSLVNMHDKALVRGGEVAMTALLDLNGGAQTQDLLLAGEDYLYLLGVKVRVAGTMNATDAIPITVERVTGGTTAQSMLVLTSNDLNGDATSPASGESVVWQNDPNEAIRPLIRRDVDPDQYIRVSHPGGGLGAGSSNLVTLTLTAIRATDQAEA